MLPVQITLPAYGILIPSRSILNSNQILYRARHLAIFLSTVVDDRTSCDFNGNLFINLEELIFEDCIGEDFVPETHHRMWCGEAKALRLDDGSEHISQKFRQWADDYGIELQFIQPCKPAQNAYVERFNRTVRQE